MSFGAGSSPVWMLARSDLRQRRGSLVMTALLVAIVACTSLATTAGARRSASSLDRLLAATDAGDVQVAVWGADATTQLGARMPTLTGIEDVGLAHTYMVGAPTRRDFSIVSSPDGSMLQRSDRPLVLDGRLPAIDMAGEVALNEVAATDLGLEVGDHLVAPLAGPELFPTLVAGGAFPGFTGPRIDLDVVGIIRLPQDLVSGTEADPVGLASPAFDRAYSGRAAVSTLASARAELPGAVDQLRQIVDGLSISAMGTEVRQRDAAYSDVRSAIDMLSTGLVVFALLAATAGALTIAQVLSRQVAAAAAHCAVGRAIGLSPRQAAWSSAAPTVVAGAIGTVVGAVGRSVPGRLRSCAPSERTSCGRASRLLAPPSPSLSALWWRVQVVRHRVPDTYLGLLTAPGCYLESMGRLIGRDAEWERLTQLTAAGGVVTLTGPGGVGKSWLASEFVSVHLERTGEAVTVGLLASVPAGSGTEALVDALGFESLDAATMVLADRKGFVLLDNCEHVIEAAREVADEIRASAGSVVVLTTSREPLGVADEHVLVVEPLALPAPGGADAEDSPSVALFLERAASAGASLEPGTALLADVAELCRRLDGLPLAIELAAARAPRTHNVTHNVRPVLTSSR